MQKLKYLYIFLIFIALSPAIYSQTGNIRGFVYDKENGEPIIFCNVYIKGTPYGSVTDLNGYFNLSKVKPGKYKLSISYLGYDSLSVPIEVKANAIVDQKLFISKSSIMLKDAVISAERKEMKTEIRTSIIKVSPKQITQIPTIGAQPDIAQYLQVLPGVVFTGDQGGQLYIRGGPPIENKVLLDGMVIYNPFHSIGLFSVFDTDIIKNADVYTGGFNAEYGGRISSIMDIRTKDGNKKQFSGKLSADPFGSKLLVEGPLKKQSEDGGGSSSYVLSGKTSYLEQSSKLLYNYIDTAGLPFNFTDLYGKISFNGDNGSKFSLFGFNFNDHVSYQAISDLNWKATGVGANAVIVPGSSPVLIKTNFSYSDYNISLKELDDRIRNSKINGFNLGFEFVYFLGKNEFDYGIEILGSKTDFNYYNTVGRHIYQIENTTELAAYLKYKINIKEKLLMEPGIRLNYYASLPDKSLEPRLGIKYNMLDFLRFKFASGFYSQNLISANSNRDVVNLFSGFLSGPNISYLPETFEGKEITSSLQKSFHIILGTEIDLSERVNLNVEGYYKKNSNLLNLNRNKIYDDNLENSDIADYLKKDFIVESGKAYGIDFLLKYDYKRVYVWAVYSLGYVERYDGVITYNPHFDRRHNVNLVTSVTFGENLDWEFSARWNLGSGFPFTQTAGFYEKFPFTNGIYTNYTSENGELGILYGELNQGRLPYYHRLDATLKKMFYFGETSKLEATLSITNIYNRKNIFYFDRIKYESVYQLPFMPSIGLSLTF